MMNLMNTPCVGSMSMILAEDVAAPELRNPVHGGMRASRKGLMRRLLRAVAAGR